MVKFVSLVLLYTSALVAQTVALSLRQENTPSVKKNLFSVVHLVNSDVLFSLIQGKAKDYSDVMMF